MLAHFSARSLKNKKKTTKKFHIFLYENYPLKLTYILEWSLISRITQILRTIWNIFYYFLKNLAQFSAEKQSPKNKRTYPEKISYIFWKNYALKISCIMEWSLTWPIITTLCSLWKISYIFLQKKKASALSRPKPEKQKKQKEKAPKTKLKNTNQNPPLKTWKKCIYISGWRLTADG